MLLQISSGLGPRECELAVGKLAHALCDEFEGTEILEMRGEVKFERMHAGGPGGQNVNKVETGVRLTHVPTGIVVACTSERSQHQNKRIALARLQEKLQALGDAAKAQQKDGAWRDHTKLVRGNAGRVYEGIGFRLKSTN